MPQPAAALLRHLAGSRPCNRLPLRELLQDCRCRDNWTSPLEDGALALLARQEAAHRRLQLRRRCLDAIYVPIEDTITVLL